MTTGSSIEQLRRTLSEQAEVADQAASTMPHQRAATVVRRARAARRRRIRVGGGLAVAVTAAVAAVVLNGPLPGPGRHQDATPVAPVTTPAPTAPTTAGSGPHVSVRQRTHSGYRFPTTLDVAGRTYELGTAYTAARGWGRIHIIAEPTSFGRALAWSSSPGTRGTVTVVVDGVTVSRSSAGALESGAVLSPGRKHVVTVKADRLGDRQSLSLVEYEEVAR